MNFTNRIHTNQTRWAVAVCIAAVMAFSMFWTSVQVEGQSVEVSDTPAQMTGPVGGHGGGG